MGWFDEQIKQRKIKDEEAFEEAFIALADAVLGEGLAAALKSDSEIAKDAIDEIAKFYRIKTKDIPDDVTDVNDQLEYTFRPYGIMRRNVTLPKGWYKDAIGPMLATSKEDGKLLALIPTGFNGYSFTDVATGKKVRVSKKNEDLIDSEAMAFYLPFPLKKIGIPDLIKYMIKIMSVSDYVVLLLITLMVTLLGMLTPYFQNILMGDVIASGRIKPLIGIATVLICASISGLILSAAKSLALARIDTKMDVYIEAATMMRILSLPADFFKDYSAGELLQRIESMNSLCNMLTNVVLQTGLTSVFSLIYISQIFSYAKGLVVPSLCVLLITLIFTIVSAMVNINISRQTMLLSSKESGMSFALISGIQKIRLAGAEKRAFARWGRLYAKVAKYTYDPPMLIKLNAVISLAISLTGTLVMYYMAIKSHVSVADYYSFTTAYGMVSGAFMSLIGVALSFATIKPTLEMIKPVMDAEPEISEGKEMVTKIGGGVELSHVSFRYNDKMPYVVDDLSLKIRPGQYVAIVGKTGCGKSTLVRLLLGFEKPEKGAIYYDGKDMNGLDLKSLRQKIGVVIQNGKLFEGDIFTNITVAKPLATMDDAWEAAELAGFADDIKNMPMGMFTYLAEGGGGISGGQRQRLMIARAIAPKPKLLIMDEATSALDNITQKKVSDSLDSLKCTRIIIAHRLSTIKHCDRILVLDNGKIIEDGKYDELIEKNGYFAELVSRQRLDVQD